MDEFPEALHLEFPPSVARDTPEVIPEVKPEVASADHRNSATSTGNSLTSVIAELERLPFHGVGNGSKGSGGGGGRVRGRGGRSGMGGLVVSTDPRRFPHSRRKV